ncbi:MAG: ABC transporter permease [Actinomycetota bacterium]|nr:ABC transporter permease [Actinomycetota bacterium]
MRSTDATILPGRGARTWLGAHGWTAGVWLLLLALVGWYATLIPRFGSFEITSIIKNGLPFAYLAVAQAVIVIAGGIDLSVGAMMVLTNSVAARYMEGQPLAVTLLLGVAIIVGAALMNGSVGWIIERSRVPDIVVTLATSFILSGLALLVLPSPGGGTSDGFRWLFSGSTSGIGTNFWPSMVALAIPVAMVAWWLGTTRPGLSLYALGSSRMAAYLSGLDVRRSKMVAYAVGGMFAALAGLATTAIIGRGDPRFSLGANATLNSVAAIVLGGIALTGGIGSVLGAVAAGIILFFLNPVLTAMGIDPNQAQVVQGLLIALVMMIAGLLELRRQRAS